MGWLIGFPLAMQYSSIVAVGGMNSSPPDCDRFKQRGGKCDVTGWSMDKKTGLLANGTSSTVVTSVDRRLDTELGTFGWSNV